MPVDLPGFISSRKRISGSPVWDKLENDFQLVSVLEWFDGVTIEGALLRARAKSDLRQQAVMIQLEYQQKGRSDSAVYRVDWKPLHNHTNDRRGPYVDLHGRIILGSHVHAFDYNWLTDQGRLLNSNLPIAAEMLPEPQSYSELLKVASASFNVSNMDVVSMPEPWERREADLFNEGD